ncbi:hypothetical protein Hanom_Chr02g00154001 [Helianthus anomalus]
MSVRYGYGYGTVSVLYRILRVGIGIIPISYRTDTENAKKWIPIGIGMGSVRDRYEIGIRWHMLIPSGEWAFSPNKTPLHTPKPSP